ncbi:MAG: tRNA (N(6)-L-threonylcarbamoyladenosine(37)-C(2))-methylthiotransferase MtaB, partial [Syntrophales bacterium]
MMEIKITLLRQKITEHGLAMKLTKRHDDFKVSVITLGCKVNQYESAVISAALEEKGYSVIPFLHREADTYIINTCSVTNQTDFQCRQMIRRAVRSNPEAVVIVTGCYAQVNPNHVAMIPGVSIVVGNMEKNSIPDILTEMLSKTLSSKHMAGNKTGIQYCSGMPEILVGSFQQAGPLPFDNLRQFTGHTRAFLKIQDGCNAHCSYCIVPHARGPSRSLPYREALKGIQNFRWHGYKEIVLTGIHLGAYGVDLNHSVSLIDLLKPLEGKYPDTRIRMSSIEPLEIDNVMIDFLAHSRLVCPHIHIPLQSGDDNILSSMGRHYNSNFFRNLLDKIFTAMPDAAIGLDILAGFPGENEMAFNQTLGLIEQFPIAYLHVFPYSQRPGTPAASFPNQVSDQEKKRRTFILRTLGRHKRQAFAERFVGKTLMVLIEGKKDRQSGFHKGFSENYIPVLLNDGSDFLTNQVLP